MSMIHPQFVRSIFGCLVVCLSVSSVAATTHSEFATSDDLVATIHRANSETPNEQLHRILALTEEYRDQKVVDQLRKHSNEDGYLWATYLLIGAGLLDRAATKQKSLEMYEQRKDEFESRHDGPLPLSPSYVNFDRLHLIGDLDGLNSIIGDIRRSTTRVHRDNDSICHAVQLLYLTYAQKDDFYYEDVLRQVRSSFRKAKNRHKMFCAKVIKASGLELSSDEQEQVTAIFERQFRERRYAGDYALALLELGVYHPEAEKQLWDILSRDLPGGLGVRLEALSRLIELGRDAPENVLDSIFESLISDTSSDMEDRIKAIAYLIKSGKLKKVDLEKIDFSALASDYDFFHASRYLVEVINN